MFTCTVYIKALLAIASSVHVLTHTVAQVFSAKYMYVSWTCFNRERTDVSSTRPLTVNSYTSKVGTQGKHMR